MLLLRKTGFEEDVIEKALKYPNPVQTFQNDAYSKFDVEMNHTVRIGVAACPFWLP